MKNFIRTLWPEAVDGNFTIWLLNNYDDPKSGSPKSTSLHAPLAEVLALSEEDLVGGLHERNADKHVYFGVGLRADGLSARQAGRKDDIVALPAFGLDIDIYNPVAHKATNLPRTEEEAMELFLDEEPPTVLIHSGNGLQAWWCFDEPWMLKTGRDRAQVEAGLIGFQEKYRRRATERGWQLDKTDTIQRVWRAPGFVNHKTGAVSRTLFTGEDRYRSSSLVPPEIRRKISAPKAPPHDEPAPPMLDNPAAPQELLDRLSRVSPTKSYKRMIDLVLAGQSFAERGGRDAALHRVCSVIAYHAKDQHTADELAEILRPSLTTWASEDGATKTVEQEIDKAIDKLLRAQQDKFDDDENERPQLIGLAKAIRMRAPGEVPVTIMDSEGNTVLVEPTGTAEHQPKEFVKHHGVIQVRSSFWVWDFRVGKYVGPKIKDEILTFARDAWSTDGAEKAGFSLEFINAEREDSHKTVVQVMREYGTVAKDVIGKLALDESIYDADNQRFIEAITPMRVLEPVYNEQIDHWLSLLVGERKEKLLDWIAAVPQLDEQCCALYLDGVSGAGKGLLASGLARLWTEGGPASLVNILGNFNADMFRCPLILLDEGLPKSKGDVSAEVRRIIGSLTHTLAEKYVVNRSVNGAVRLLVAANNPDVLTFSEENMTANDGEAIVNRILHIEARREAADWLKEHNAGGEMTKAWVQGDLIAKHCIWLGCNRQITRGRRFLVEGETVDDMHRKIIMQGGVTGLICEWLARFATNPGAVASSSGKLVAIGGKHLLINTQGLIDGWGSYMKRGEREIPLPSTTKVGAALTKLSGGRSKKLGLRAERINYHDIDVDMVKSWSNTNQIGNEDKINENLEKSLRLIDDNEE